MEKCIDHPWATNKDGNCWKCKELDEQIKDCMFQPIENTHIGAQDTADYIDKHLVAALVATTTDFIPKPKDTITTEVMKDLKSRADKGLQKYSTTLDDNDHQNMLQHAYEEALDMAQYLKKEITTLNTIQDLVREYPNDMQLGAKIREKYVRK
jgi:hypothetical protein